MRTLGFFIYKELLQIFRNKAMLPLLFVVPLVQLLVLSFVATNEVRDLKLSVLDYDRGPLAARLVHKMTASGYFRLTDLPRNEAEAGALLDRDAADLVLVLPPHFERDLRRGEPTEVQVLANAINSMKAGLAVSYAGSIVGAYQRELLHEGRIPLPAAELVACSPALELRYRHWFNPQLDYKRFMVPGILAVLVSMLSLLLGAMNVVREREIGTQEQIAVSPVSAPVFIAGKLLPFLFIGLLELSIGLGIAKLLFHTPTEGPLGVLYLFAALA
ncbi:MAG: ABC transporter permease, partial [Bacteroidetes bacterium]